jgi:hypothetical protein
MLTPGSSHVTGALVQPSPVKKKLSLGDYMSRRTKAEKAGKAEAAAEKERTKSDANSETGQLSTTTREASVPNAGQSSPTVEPKPLTTVAEEIVEADDAAKVLEINKSASGEGWDVTRDGGADQGTTKAHDGDAMELDSVPPALLGAEEGEVKAELDTGAGTGTATAT